jgi:hypothetical protein
LKHRLLLVVSLVLLVIAFALYAEIQLVSKGPFGTDSFLPCFARSPNYFTYGGTVGPNSCTFLNNDQLLEGTGFASFFTFLTWNYLGDVGEHRVRFAIGRALLAYGSVIGAIVFVTNYVLWKLPGYDWVGNPWGLPWWSEQVTYQSCFIKQADFTSTHPNCVFLNYGNVLEICVVLVIIGFYLSTWYGAREK